MHLRFTDVNDAFRALAGAFMSGRLCGVPLTEGDSRCGRVRRLEEPLTVTYELPGRRVLANRARDANPFFHLAEAMWMLAGRDDVRLPATYVKRVAEFSDDGRTLGGAYGRRWRRHVTSRVDDRVGPDPLEVDQLDYLASHLAAFPDSRRAVLQMWDVEQDMLRVGCGACHFRDRAFFFADPGPCQVCGAGYRSASSAPGKDVCCNTEVMFRRRQVTGTQLGLLDMTVINRSNDLVWGMLGGDYVAFSFLQEYMAARTGCGVGLYHHVTNDLHAYVERDDWRPRAWLDDDAVSVYDALGGSDRDVPLVADWTTFDSEVRTVLDQYHRDAMDEPFREYDEPFVSGVLQPALDAHLAYRMRACTAVENASRIESPAWRRACVEWLQKRGGRK